MPRTYPRVFELELWTRPGLRSPLDGKAVAQDCRDATGLSELVVVGLNLLADETDPINLLKLLDADPSHHAAFHAFCSTEGLAPDVNDQASACRYLGYVNGQPLAWLHFPAGEPGPAMARGALGWALSKDFVLVEPGTSVQLLDEEALSSVWQQ